MPLLGIMLALLGVLILMLAIKGGYKFIPPFGKAPTTENFTPPPSSPQAQINHLLTIGPH